MLSKKFKTQLKKIAINTTLAVSAMVVLFVMCVNFDSRMNRGEEQTGLVNSQGVGAGNQVEIIKDSNGISVKVRAEDNSGIRSIEVLQGGTSVGTYNFDGSNAVEEKTVGLSIPFGETKDIVVKVNGNTVKQESVNNMRCISTAQDFAKFRDLVNAGNNFSGKYVELTNDIDLSSVCSSSVGSWTPIGASGTLFAGVFNGNYHVIKNLYINNNNQFAGLFSRITNASTVVENFELENIYLKSTCTTANTWWLVGGICGQMTNGTLKDIGIKSGSVLSDKTVNNTSTSDGWGIYSGGLIGQMFSTTSSTVLNVVNCYNKATVYARVNNVNNNLAISGGIIGSCIVQGATPNIKNCYNLGSVQSYGYGHRTGGVLGELGTQAGKSSRVVNCYNAGTIVATPVGSSWNTIAGLMGTNGWSAEYPYVAATNCYALDNATYSFHYFTNRNLTSTAGRVSAATLKVMQTLWVQITGLQIHME